MQGGRVFDTGEVSYGNWEGYLSGVYIDKSQGRACGGKEPMFWHLHVRFAFLQRRRVPVGVVPYLRSDSGEF